MLELTVLGIFSAVLLTCIVLDYSILYALLAGYLIFFTYGLVRKFTVVQILKMSWSGVKTIKNILITFVLIGMITAVWRDCGTIPFIIYHSSKIIVPSVFVLVAFLLCCLISFLTGTAFGTVATVGVICMTLANAMEISPVLMGGAILSGIFFGDRCSLMSTSALLVSELTETDIYINVKNMMRTSLVPFFLSCLLYLFLGMRQTTTEATTQIWDLFPANFALPFVVVLPAVLIIALCLFKVKVKIAMLASVLIGSMISIVVQKTGFSALLKLLVTGFESSDQQLSAMMDGGGITSMLRVMAIVCLSSCYAGIFEGTGLLNGVKSRIISLGNKITAYGSLLVSSVLTSMIACNQTLSIMLTHYLCKDAAADKEQFAVDLENTVVVIAPMIPWSIACAVPLAAIGAPNQSILAACYLYLLPLWNFLVQRKKLAAKNSSL